MGGRGGCCCIWRLQSIQALKAGFGIVQDFATSGLSLLLHFGLLGLLMCLNSCLSEVCLLSGLVLGRQLGLSFCSAGNFIILCWRRGMGMGGGSLRWNSLIVNRSHSPLCLRNFQRLWQTSIAFRCVWLGGMKWRRWHESVALVLPLYRLFPSLLWLFTALLPTFYCRILLMPFFYSTQFSKWGEHNVNNRIANSANGQWV